PSLGRGHEVDVEFLKDRLRRGRRPARGARAPPRARAGGGTPIRATAAEERLENGPEILGVDVYPLAAGGGPCEVMPSPPAARVPRPGESLPRMPERVVVLPLLLVGKDVVGFLHLGELLLCVGRL